MKEHHRKPVETPFHLDKILETPRKTHGDPRYYMNLAFKELMLRMDSPEEAERIYSLADFINEYPENIIPDMSHQRNTGIIRLGISLDAEDYTTPEPVLLYKPSLIGKIPTEHLAYELYREAFMLEAYEGDYFTMRLSEITRNAILVQKQFIWRWGKHAQYQTILNPVVTDPDTVVRSLLQKRFSFDFSLSDLKNVITQLAPSEHHNDPYLPSSGVYAYLFSLWEQCHNNSEIFVGFREYIQLQMSHLPYYNPHVPTSEKFYYLNAHNALWTLVSRVNKPKKRIIIH